MATKSIISCRTPHLLLLFIAINAAYTISVVSGESYYQYQSNHSYNTQWYKGLEFVVGVIFVIFLMVSGCIFLCYCKHWCCFYRQETYYSGV